MKIDVEEVEMEALEGGRQRIRKDRPAIWVELPSEDARKSCFPLLESWGYRTPEKMPPADFLFCPRGTESAS